MNVGLMLALLKNDDEHRKELLAETSPSDGNGIISESMCARGVLR